MIHAIFSKILPSILTKERKSPHQFTENESLLINVCSLNVQDALLKLNSNIKGLVLAAL